MPFNIGAPELIIILIIALIVLGPGKLPDVAQSLGKSVREFRKAVTDVSDAANPNATAAPGTGTPAAPGATQPNSLTGEAAPNTLGGSAASPTSPTSGDDSPAAPAS
jgi:TatA/E family protein of Tat protein translocase